MGLHVIFIMAYGKQADADFMANTFERFLKGKFFLYLECLNSFI